MLAHRHWQRHLDEVYVKFDGLTHSNPLVFPAAQGGQISDMASHERRIKKTATQCMGGGVL